MSNVTMVERLSYFNGRRLEAADLELEQRYHIEMRRRFNRAQFTPGVVAGLEVAHAIDPKDPAKKRKLPKTVRVASGLALDPLGREIVVSEQTLDVPAQPPTKNGGYFLVAQYNEERLPADDDPCRPPGASHYARTLERA